MSLCAESLQSCLTPCDPMDYRPPPRLLCPWDFPGTNGVFCHALLQGIFLTQRYKLAFLKSPALASRFCNTSATCCCSVTHSCPTFCNPWAGALQASLFFTISQSLFKLLSIESVIPPNYLILCYLLLLLPSNLSQHQGHFQWVGSSHQVAKVLKLHLQH